MRTNGMEMAGLQWKLSGSNGGALRTEKAKADFMPCPPSASSFTGIA